MTKAINLSLSPVELAAVNGPGMLAAATDDSEGKHERDLTEVTSREKALARAGTILLQDKAGRKRTPPPAEPTTGGDGP